MNPPANTPGRRCLKEATSWWVMGGWWGWEFWELFMRYSFHEHSGSESATEMATCRIIPVRLGYTIAHFKYSVKAS